MAIELTPKSLRQAADDFRARYEPGKVRGVLVAGSAVFNQKESVAEAMARLRASLGGLTD